MTIGIYRITLTKPNGDQVFYVGQSINCERRRLEHFGDLRRGKHYSQKMQNAFNKYGEHSLTFEVIEQCKPDELNDRERNWLIQLVGQPHSFNVSDTPEATTRGLKQSDKTKKKIAEKQKGKRHSTLTRKLISNIQKGKKRGPASEERKRKISEAQSGAKNHSFGKTGLAHHRSKPVVSTNLKTGEKRFYGSGWDAARDGFSQPSISGVCNGKWASHRGYSWRFANEQEISESQPAQQHPQELAASHQILS